MPFVGRAGAAVPFDLGRDGNPRAYKGADVRVLHLHGYWRDSNPLHTPYELRHARPQVEHYVRDVISKRPLVCLGYGGWEDIITNTVAEVLMGHGDAELLWTFREQSEADVRRKQGRILDLLAPLVALGSGTMCFFGVDVHRFLPELHARLVARRAASGRNIPKALEHPSIASRPQSVSESPVPAHMGLGDEPRCPYIVGRPIDRDEDFHGRTLHRQRLEQAVVDRQPVQILGERRMGKTSLLRWCGRMIRRQTDLPIVEVTLGGVATPSTLVGRMAEGLARDVPLDDPAAVLRSLCPLALLVDEADALLARMEPEQDSFFDTCRALTQERKLLWISASRLNLFQQLRSADLTSSFLNDAAPLPPTGLLEAGATRKLVESGLPGHLVERVLELAGRTPFGVQWLCSELWWSSEDVEQARVFFSEGMRPHFEDWWTPRTGHERRFLARCVTPAKLDGLTQDQRGFGRGLQLRGFLEEVDGMFVLPGRAWRDFVEERTRGEAL